LATIVGIAVLTIVASIANRKITSITPEAARLRFDLVARDDCGGAVNVARSIARGFARHIPHELN
jgi:hypothetical protein